MLVRTRRDQPYCDVAGPACLGSVTRFVWSGDQILWELKEVESSSYATGMGGRVSYLHAGGIDRPLAIWKQEVGTIVTHQNWRGQFALGTFTNGQPSDCAEYPPQGCIPVRWPGWATTAWHQEVQKAPVTGYEHYWLGSLAVEMRDASGQLYRRNRYYDPATGQFTQPDPIGLAGGLNAYGFAEGDPVSFSDPYGLKVCANRAMRRRIEQTFQMEISWDTSGCVDENSTLKRLAGSGSRAELQDQFIYVVRSGLDIEVTWRDRGDSFFKPPANIFDDADIGIAWPQAYEPYGIERNGQCVRVSPWGVHALIAHEFGHAYNFLKHGDGQVQAPAIRSENLFNSALGRPARSERCHP